jgi:hypothetical protein
MFDDHRYSDRMMMQQDSRNGTLRFLKCVGYNMRSLSLQCLMQFALFLHIAWLYCRVDILQFAAPRVDRDRHAHRLPNARALHICMVYMYKPCERNHGILICRKVGCYNENH